MSYFFKVKIILIGLLLSLSPFPLHTQPTNSSNALKDSYSPYFSVGVAMPIRAHKLHKNKMIIKTHFNSITPENQLKPQSILSKTNQYDWRMSDQIIRYARNNDIPVRGHTLVWHKQTPEWFFKDNAGHNLSCESLTHKLRQYMKEVMGRYQNDVYAWDVVNEAVNDAHNEGVYRNKNSMWFEICGISYIEKAFRIAHDLFPEAKLFYNDYNFLDPVKQDRLFNLIERLLDNGTPVHGIGIQAHWSIYDSAQDVDRLLQRFKVFGIQIQITELDLSIHKAGKPKPNQKFKEYDSNIEEIQAQKFRELFSVFKKHSDVISNVSLWGVSDIDSWLNYRWKIERRDFPLLFDDDYQPKKSFYTILEEGNIR